MRLYNTLTKQIEEIKPLEPPEVTVYTCGPTVYDYPHIGNWFTFIRYDLLIRALKQAGFKPKWVMNITDVGHLVSDADEGEDKLEKGARREGKTAWDVAKFYGDYFLSGLGRLNISKPDFLPKATEHIAEQIKLVQKLEQKGYIYTITDGVYFDTSKFQSYANFAKLDVDDLLAGARVEINHEKRSQTDFALWKFSPKDHKRDMEWESPWGKGFPGWHLECSAMAMKYLGETIDIHSGGIDHVPVHHTNEIAQSEAATDKRFANYWMHTNHILINDDKISKSAGNSIKLEDIENKGYSLEAFRLLVLQSHYRSQSVFSWDTVEAAQNTLRNFQAWADLRHQKLSSKRLEENYVEVSNMIHRALQDDLNTPQVLGFISEASNHIEQLGIDSQAIGKLAKEIDELCGFSLTRSDDINTEIMQILNDRQKARDSKDWTKSDELRDQLKLQGIGVRDVDQGQVWYRL